MLLGTLSKSNAVTGQPGEGDDNLGEISYKSPIVADQSQKTLDIGRVSRHLPSHNRLNLGRINQNPIVINEVSQELGLS